MRFDNLNETGIVLPAQDQMRFTYASEFYGECSFVAVVAETFEQGLIIDARSIEWEQFLPRHGGREALGHNALVFFNRILRGHESLKQFEVKVKRRRSSGLLGKISSSLFREKTRRATQLGITT